MKLKEIYKLTLNRIGEMEGNRQIINLIMSGINAGYKIIATKNKQSKTIDISVEVNTPLNLPIDFVNLVMLIKEGTTGGRLSETDYIINGDLILVTNPDFIDDLLLTYNFIPTDLVYKTDDEVEPSIQSAFHVALASYAAYYYYIFKDNLNAAQLCLNEFNTVTGLAEQIDINTNSDMQNATSNKK